MDITQTGRYFIDGADLFTYYGVGVESGSDDFLKFAKPKERITHDWTDENGIDVDLSRTFIQPKEIELKCHLLAISADDFWLKYNRLQTRLNQPGLRRITVTELGHDFFVTFRDCVTYQRFTRLQQSNVVASKFGLKFTEVLPQLTTQIFINDDAGNFIIT